MEIKREHVSEGSKQLNRIMYDTQKTKFQYTSIQYPRLQTCFQITIEGSTLDLFPEFGLLCVFLVTQVCKLKKDGRKVPNIVCLRRREDV